MADLKDLLAQLHNGLVKTLLEKVSSGEATAADLSVARQLLKDNGIDSSALPGSPIRKLSDYVGNLPFPGDSGPVSLAE